MTHDQYGVALSGISDPIAKGRGDLVDRVEYAVSQMAGYGLLLAVAVAGAIYIF